MNIRTMGIRIAAVAVLAAGCFTFGVGGSAVEARTNNNWASAQRSQQCSQDAERYANRHAGRSTVGGAAGGAAIGAIAGRGRRRNITNGALIGGGAGMLHSNSRWNTFYNRRYRQCINS